MEFNPIDKIPELMELLQPYGPMIRSRSDESYDWLEENSLCIDDMYLLLVMRERY